MKVPAHCREPLPSQILAFQALVSSSGHITQFWPARRERRSVGEGSGPAFAFPSERTDGFVAVPFLPLALNANAMPKATTAILRPPCGKPDNRMPTS